MTMSSSPAATRNRIPQAVVGAAAAVLLLGPGSSAAGAAPASHCPFVSDPAGDAMDPQDSPASDLLALDVGSDRSSIAVAVSYAGEETSPLPGKGHVYGTEIHNGEAVFLVNIGITRDAAWFELAKRDVSGGGPGVTFMTWTSLGSIEGTVDRVHHRATAWFPISRTHGELTYGRRVTLSGATTSGIGMNLLPHTPVPLPDGTHPGIYSTTSDSTYVSSTYRVGTPGCAVAP